MKKNIVNYTGEQHGNWKIISMDGVAKDRHRLWNVVNVITAEKRLMPSNSLLQLKKRNNSTNKKKK